MDLIRIVLPAAALAASLSLDAFAASFAYGSKKIKIPTISVHIINIICTAIIALSFFFGAIFLQYIPERAAVSISFTILFLIGLSKLFDGISKSIIRKHTALNKKVKLSLFDFKLILHLYASPEDAVLNMT